MEILGGAQPRIVCTCTATCHIRICYIEDSQLILNFGLYVLHFELS